MMDIIFPGGLYRENDGWKLSTRIRFIHARIRSLLNNSEEWEHETWGTPVSAAHLGFAISVFSKRLLEYSLQVGARFNREERESVLAVWRYTDYLMEYPNPFSIPTPRRRKKFTRSAICASRRRTPIRSPWRTV